MGNTTNKENWAASERLNAIERAAWWRGWVSRKDLVQIFGVSLAQASSDLQKYHELNPGVLHYHMSRKRYEVLHEMRCVVHQPRIEEGVRSFLGAGNMVMVTGNVQSNELCDVVELPLRQAADRVQRWLMVALSWKRSVKVRYFSMSGEKSSWRVIVPHAFAHNGYRWHVRAWCTEHQEYRDFVLSRIEDVKIPEAWNETLPEDAAWTKEVTVELKPHSALSPERKQVVELDYGLKQGETLKLQVREAMRGYVLAHFGIHDLDLPQHFELVK